MKLVHASIISSSVVIFLGIAMIAPTFTRTINHEQPLNVALFFFVNNSDSDEWSGELSSILRKFDVKATVFFTGEFAMLHPDRITDFDPKVDIGSQTYSYVDLTSILDYSVQLREVNEGKAAVDKAGVLDSKIFRAPYGSTDDNIYSLLSRSGIAADFSYTDHFNKFYNGQFIRMDAQIYDGSQYSSNFFLSLPKANGPLIIFFDDSSSTEKIQDLISSLKSSNCWLCNASELAGMVLTIREG